VCNYRLAIRRGAIIDIDIVRQDSRAATVLSIFCTIYIIIIIRQLWGIVACSGSVIVILGEDLNFEADISGDKLLGRSILATKETRTVYIMY